MNLKKIRSHRILGIALFDLLLAIVGTVIILLIAKWKWFPGLKNVNFVIAGILLAIPLGIFFHIIIGKNTTLNYKLGLSKKPRNLLTEE